MMVMVVLRELRVRQRDLRSEIHAARGLSLIACIVHSRENCFAMHRNPGCLFGMLAIMPSNMLTLSAPLPGTTFLFRSLP